MRTIILLAAAALAQGTAVPSGDVKWAASGSLPPGAEYHLIHEDPKTNAVQTFARFPGRYKLPAHAHSHGETIVVLKGKIEITMDGKTETLGPGSYARIPAGTAHALETGRGKCEILAILDGPFDLKPAH